MDWTDLITKSNMILAGISAFLGGGWIITFYNARPKKKSIEIENLKSVIKQQGETLRARQEESISYRTDAKKEMSDMNDKINRLNMKLDLQHKAIFSAYKCKLTDEEHDCIVLNTFESCENCIYDSNMEDEEGENDECRTE